MIFPPSKENDMPNRIAHYFHKFALALALGIKVEIITKK
tara:strand:- start:513 stop:629 length:117 start_codon:yes stop_codon:yes gene_type:complete